MRTETEFRDTWLVTLARLCREHGDGQVAMWLGVSERHLRNIKAGDSMPAPFRLWNLLALDPSAHDELDALFDLKNVAKDAVCSSDPLTLDMIALAHETAQDESPDSPGGKVVTDHELLGKDEARLRKVYRTIGGWLNRLEEMRRPRVVGGKAV
jgi:hypothetical protein